MVGTNSTWNYGCSATNTLAGGEKEFGPFRIDISGMVVVTL